MPALLVLSMIVQIYFIVHVMRTGRDRYWVYIIFFFPLIGSAVYFFVEYLPAMRSSSGLIDFTDGIERMVNPRKRIRQYKFQLEIANTVANRKGLADAYMQVDQYAEAIPLYKGCLEGAYEDDIHIYEGLCWAYFLSGDYAAAKINLLKIRKMRKERKMDRLDLMLARTYSALGEYEESEKEFIEIVDFFPGAEARVRYGLLLKYIGRIEEANKQFADVLHRAQYAPGFYKRDQKPWINLAKKSFSKTIQAPTG